MSELAVTHIGGEIDTAWNYRTEFLNYGTIYTQFFCPFCDIPLFSCNIDTNEEIVRSPHFKYYSKTPHLNGCNGTPIFSNSELNKKPKSKFQPVTMLSYPEALVPRRAPRIVNTSVQSIPMNPPSPEEVETKRKNIGNRGRNTPSSSLLKPFIDAKKSVIQDGYQKFPALAERPDPAQETKRWNWIKKVWASMPLLLEDQTNYEDAFMRPQYINFYKKRIYNAQGKVYLDGESFVITGNAYIKKEEKNIDVRLFIDTAQFNTNSPQAHKKIMQMLEQQVGTETEVNWYAYGLAELNSNKDFHLKINCLDHLYLKI